MNEFFGDAASDVGYSRRLRAVVQNQLIDFAEDMRRRGHHRQIVEDGSKVNETARPTQVARSEYMEHVRRLLRRSRGQELPGTFNPLIVGVLFYEQAQPWKKIVNDRYGTLMAAVKATLAQTLEYTTDETTREGLLCEVINPAMDRHSKELEAKMSEVLGPHLGGHPITYNHYFTETVQRIQHERSERLLRERLNTFFRLPADQAATSVHERLNTGDLLRALAPPNEADMDRHACSLAVDCMEAYYQVRWARGQCSFGSSLAGVRQSLTALQVAMKVLVDSFAVLAMEYCLIDSLSAIFCPATVMEMDDSVVHNIATESHNSQIERARVNEKLRSLKAGLQTLKRLDQQKEMGNWALSMVNVRETGESSLKDGKSDPSENPVMEELLDIKGEDNRLTGSLAKEPTTDSPDSRSGDVPPSLDYIRDGAFVGRRNVSEDRSPINFTRTAPDVSWLHRTPGKRKSLVK